MFSFLNSSKKTKSTDRKALKDSRRLRRYGKLIVALDMLQDPKTNPEQVTQIESAGDTIVETAIDSVAFRAHSKLSQSILTAAEKISAPEKSIRLHFADDVYQIDIQSQDEQHHFSLGKVSQVNGSSEKDQVSKICEGKLDQKTDNLTFVIDGKQVFEEGAARPRGVQGQVLEAIGKAIAQDKKNGLLLMGTGSGKSFVIAGVPHALHKSGVYIVPNAGLAAELKKDALCRLHGLEAPVYFAAEMTIDAIQTLVQGSEQYHLIFCADDKEFHEKVRHISGQMVFIDESHQHTFEEKSIQTVQGLIQHNTVFALTGTPTSLLFSVFGDPIVDINLHQVMSKGGVRTMQTKVVPAINRQSIVQQSVLDYVSNEGYVVQGAGYRSAQDFLNEILQKNSGIDHKEAVKQAISKTIAHNRERMREEKNFIFSGDQKICNDMIAYYNTLLSNTQQMERIAIEAGHIRQSIEEEERWRLALQIDTDAQALQKPGYSLQLMNPASTGDAVEKNTIYLFIEENRLQCALLDETEEYITLEVTREALGAYYDSIMSALQSGRELTRAEKSILIRVSAANGIEFEENRQIRRDAYKSMLTSDSKVIVNLQDDLLQNQIAQINNAINAQALWLLFDDGKLAPREFELLIRTKTVGEYVTKNAPKNANAINELYTNDIIKMLSTKKIAAQLPEQQRAQILALIAERAQLFAQAMLPNPNSSRSRSENLDTVMQEQNALIDQSRLTVLQAQYIALAPDISPVKAENDVLDKEAETLLEQFRFGLVHHVVSSKRFTTGTSIPSVRSCQQVICDEQDPLVKGIETMQLVARGIRDKDGVSLVAQYYASDKVRSESFFKAADVIHPESGSRIQRAYKKQEKFELKRSKSQEQYLGVKRSISEKLETEPTITSVSHEKVEVESNVVKNHVSFFETATTDAKAVAHEAAKVDAQIVSNRVAFFETAQIKMPVVQEVVKVDAKTVANRVSLFEAASGKTLKAKQAEKNSVRMADALISSETQHNTNQYKKQ